MLFAGSRLLPQVFSCHSNSATDNEKCATSGFAYSSQHAITEVDCAINEPRTATDKDFKQTDDSIGPVLATNAISIKQLDCGLSEGELEQLAASATDLRNGTFSGVFSSQGCPETESVDSVTFGDFPSDRELDSDLKSALSEAGLMEKQISVKDKEKNDTKSTESAPASRERRRRTRVPVSDEGEPRLQRQPKKSSTSEGRGMFSVVHSFLLFLLLLSARNCYKVVYVYFESIIRNVYGNVWGLEVELVSRLLSFVFRQICLQREV
jgi:hypothetical protein